MSLSNESTLDDEMFVRYLLGQLSEEEAERVDELTIADDETAWRLRAAEDDLVDAYVRGTLDDLTRARFERVYLATPRRREKLRFAQSLVRSIDTGAPAAALSAIPAAASAVHVEAARAEAGVAAARSGVASSAEERPRWYQRLFPQTAAGWSLVGVAALLALVCGALMVQTARLRDELNVEHAERLAFGRHAEDLQHQLDAQQAAAVESGRQLQQVRTQLAEVTQRTAANATPSASLSSLLTGAVALVLSPQTRSGGGTPAVALRPGVETVPFALLLESDDFSRYQVALKDPATNAIIWRSERLAPTNINQAPTVLVAVPARLLKAQHYAFDLSGARTGGGADVVGSYVVKIVQ